MAMNPSVSPMKRPGDVREGHARGRTHEQRSGGESDEGRQFDPGDEDHDQPDAKERDEQQGDGVDGRHAR
jgi:hypothetical protein